MQYSPRLTDAKAVCAALCLALLGLGIAAAKALAEEAAQPRITQTQLLAMPMQFEKNEGQVDNQVQFLSRGQGYTLWLTKTQAVLSLRTGKPRADVNRSTRIEHRRRRHGEIAQVDLRMSLVGANPACAVEGIEQLEGTINYFIGQNEEKWRAGIPAYGRVKYHSVYPGIDLVYYGNQANLEYDFVVSPGADANQIALLFEGAAGLEITDQGGLLAHIAGGDVYWHKPLVYQETSSGRTEIPASFVLKNEREAGFVVAGYDARLPLIIDPVLVYSTFLGTSANDETIGIAVDSNGNAYVAGNTTSLNFPTVSAYRTTSAGTNEVFITKINTNGHSLVYSTYLGGSGNDYPGGIAVDSSGNAYVTGETDSPNFPTKNPAVGSNAGFSDAFISKLGPFGTNLLYSSYLGGGGDDFANAVAVDNSGNAYIAGETYSVGTGNSPFLTVPQGAFQRQNGGGRDCFVAKFNTTLSGSSSLIYSTFLGGNTDERANAIAIDSLGTAYVTGSVEDFNSIPPTLPHSNFPLVNAYQSAFNPGITDGFSAGSSEAFVTRFNAAGTALIFSTFLGGGFDDTGTGIAVNSKGRIFVSGETSSTNFPVLKAAQPVIAGLADTDQPGPDMFITEFQTNGTALLYSTYLGGSGYESGFSVYRGGIAIDSFDNIYVAGWTDSLDDFPITPGADQTQSFGPPGDAFVAKINPAVSGPAGLIYSSFLSGNSDDRATGIAVDQNGGFYVTGFTSSTTNFPVSALAFRGTNSGGLRDAFISKFASPADLSVTAIPSLEPVVVGSNLTFSIQINNNGRTTFTGITNQVQLPANAQLGAITTSQGAFNNAGGGLVIFNIGTMTNNAAVTQSIAFSNPAPGTNTITASLTANEPEFNTSNNVAAVVSTVRGAADVAVTQTSAPNPVTVGSNLLYTITVTNKGFWPASSITLTDTLPAGFQFASVSPSQFCTTNDAGQVFCTGLGPIPQGGTTIVTILGVAGTSGQAINVATVSAFELDPVAANNSSTSTTAVNPLADLALGQTASASSVLGGTMVTNTILITNLGPSTATSIAVTNLLPAGVAFISAASPQGTTAFANGIVSCTIPSIGVNGRASLVIAVQTLLVGSITNTATITSSATDPRPTNNSTSLVTTVLPAADLGILETATPGTTLISSNLTFSLLVSNAGPSTATNVVVSGPLNPVFSTVSVPAPCVVSNGVLVCNLGNLANGAAATLNVQVKAGAYGIYTNTATVVSSGTPATPDAFPNNNSAAATAVINDFPAAPTLRVTTAGNNVILSWSTNSLAGRLQSKTNVATNIPWADLTYSHVAVGNQFKFTNAITGSTRFFRLAQ